MCARQKHHRWGTSPQLYGNVKLNHGVADRKIAFADGEQVLDVSLSLYMHVLYGHQGHS